MKQLFSHRRVCLAINLMLAVFAGITGVFSPPCLFADGRLSTVNTLSLIHI